MLDFLKFYNRPQTYQARIEVTVKNTSNQIKKATLVVPLPLSADYQIITPVFNEPKMMCELELQPGREELVSVPFQARVMPRRVDEKNIAAGIKMANEFVIGYLQYGDPIEGLYSAREARQKRVVDCGGFDSLMQEELAKQGIDSKIVAGFWAGYPTGGMHAWLEIMGSIPADPSMEFLYRRGRSKKSGKLGFVGSDRIAISAGGEFLQNPFLLIPDDDITYEKHFYCTRA